MIDLTDAEPVGFFVYWLKPMFYNLAMFRTHHVYRQIIQLEHYPGNLKYVPAIGMIKRRYLRKEKLGV